MIVKFLPLLVVFGLLVGLARDAKGQEEAPPQGNKIEDMLQQADRLYEGLEYDQALALLVQILQTPGVTDIQKVRTFLYLGVCFTAVGKAENAVQAFVDLLRIKSDFRLPENISPSIAAMFKEALQRLKLPEAAPTEASGGGGGKEAAGAGTGLPVSVDVSAPKESASGSPLDIKIAIEDPQSMVQHVVLRWRMESSKEFSTVRVPYSVAKDVLVGRIPGAALADQKGKVLFYAEALGEGGMTVGYAGSQQKPFEVNLLGGTKTKRRWSLWALGIAGALVVVGGAAVGIYYGVRASKNGAPSTTADVTLLVR